MMTAVAAAASVPASSTAMYASWITSLMYSGSCLVMPEKSAVCGSKAYCMPSAFKASARPACVLNLNFGMVRSTCAPGASAPATRADEATLQLSLDLRESALIGNDQQHGQFVPGVGELHRLPAVALRVGESGRLAHHRRGHRGAGEGGELTVRRQGLVERRRPARVEVHGVDQYKPSEFVESALRDQILDLVRRLSGHPIVDRRAGVFGGRLVVHQAHPGPVVGGKGIEEELLEREVLLRPQTVGGLDAPLPGSLPSESLPCQLRDSRRESSELKAWCRASP